jgi:predicted RNase H-like HicB family nuclease
MSEKNYVVNVKNKLGTIVTFRGDTASELNKAISDFIELGMEFAISNVEGILLGTSSTPDPVSVVTQALGGTVISETPTPAFAPVPPPVAPPASAPAVGARMCNHGPMIGRKGTGAKGEWKGLFCPTPKGTAGQCDPVWLNRSMPEWSTI